jgi:hemolysin expression modulating protein
MWNACHTGNRGRRIEKRLTAEERPAFWLATDHRRAEITMKKLYDTIPANVWRYVK